MRWCIRLFSLYETDEECAGSIMTADMDFDEYSIQDQAFSECATLRSDHRTSQASS